MAELDKVTQAILKYIDELGFKQEGAFNLRHNGMAMCHGDSEHVKIVRKEDKPGIDVYIDGDATVRKSTFRWWWTRRDLQIKYITIFILLTEPMW